MRAASAAGAAGAASAAQPSSGKSSLAMYRDMARLIKHVAGSSSPKAVHLRSIVKAQFRANAGVTDALALRALKAAAERGLSNYLLLASSKTDAKLAAYAAESERYEDTEDGHLVVVPRKPAAAGAGAATGAPSPPAAGKGRARAGAGAAGAAEASGRMDASSARRQ